MSKRKGLTVAVMLSLASAAGAATRIEARLVDDASGQPLAARVAVTNADGKFVEIDGRHEHVEYLGSNRTYARVTGTPCACSSFGFRVLFHRWDAKPIVIRWIQLVHNVIPSA